MKEVFLVYEQIIKHYLERIKTKKLLPGDYLESEEKSAAMFSVSRGTVRKAYKYLESLGVVHSIKGKGTRITEDAQDIIDEIGEIVVSQSKHVGLMVLESNEYLSEIVDAMKQNAKQFGWTIEVAFNGNEYLEKACIARLIEHRVDGVVIIPYRSREGFCLRNFLRLKEAKIPYVMIGRPPKTLSCDAVYADDYKASYRITKLLYKQRFTKEIYITDSSMDSVVKDDRLNGYLDAIKELKQRESYIFDVRDPGFVRKMNEFLANNCEKIGINVFSNELFRPIKKILDEHGAVKNRDYDIVGFYEQNFKGYSKYNIMQVPKVKIVRSALEILRQRIEGGGLIDEDNAYVTHKIFDADFKSVKE